MVSTKTTHVRSQQGYRKHSDLLAPRASKTRKASKQMEEENLTDESTDVWYDNIE
jgi:hypothetical protein